MHPVLGVRSGRSVACLAAILALPLLASCGGGGDIRFDYPAEKVDLQLRNLRTPALYIDSVVDRRPVEQRTGGGYFLRIRFPKADDWADDPAVMYAEALAQDVEQTHLVELVPLRAQADYVLSAELLSLGCEFERSATSFLIPGLIGSGIGLAFGDGLSSRLKRAAAGAAIAIIATPMPSHNRAEAEVRLTLKDMTGNVLWQAECLGEESDKVYATATSRQDKKLVNRFLPRAIKKCNGCLVGQLRARLLELGSEQ